MCKFCKGLTFWLVIIGALNWALVGLFNFDLVSFIFGDMTLWTRIIYITIGLAAIVYAAVSYASNRSCESY